MASSSLSNQVYIHLTDLNYHPSSLTNPHIHIVPAEDPQNKYSSDCLVFVKEGLKNFPIVCHQGRWYELYHDKKTNQPFLGPFHSEVHATDVKVTPTEESADNQDKSEPEEDDEPEADKGLRHTSVVIDPTGLGSPHRESREPWAHLVTLMRQYSITPLVSTKQQTNMGSTTAAVTTTTTHTGPSAAATAPAAPAAPPAPAAAPTGGAAQPGVDDHCHRC